MVKLYLRLRDLFSFKENYLLGKIERNWSIRFDANVNSIIEDNWKVSMVKLRKSQ